MLKSFRQRLEALETALVRQSQPAPWCAKPQPEWWYPQLLARAIDAGAVRLCHSWRCSPGNAPGRAPETRSGGYPINFTLMPAGPTPWDPDLAFHCREANAAAYAAGLDIPELAYWRDWLLDLPGEGELLCIDG